MNELQIGQWYSLPGVDDVLIGLITREEFLSRPEWITQRNTQNRIKKKVSSITFANSFRHIMSLLWENLQRMTFGKTVQNTMQDRSGV